MSEEGKKEKEGARGTLSLNISSPSTTSALTPYPHHPHPPPSHISDSFFITHTKHPPPLSSCSPAFLFSLIIFARHPSAVIKASRGAKHLLLDKTGMIDGSGVSLFRRRRRHIKRSCSLSTHLCATKEGVFVRVR